MSEEDSNKKTDPAFQEMYIKFSGGKSSSGSGRIFDIPNGITNYYSLKQGDALQCELIELKKDQRTEEIKKEILVDIRESQSGITPAKGAIPEATVDLYGIEKYTHALLKIIKAVKKT